MRSPWLDGRELAAVALTFSGNAVVHRALPYAGHIPANLLTAGGVTGLALLAGASLDELGLSPAFARDGLRLGTIAGGAAVLVVAVGAILPSTRERFVDRRVSEAGDRRALYELAVRIPLGTALAEEVLFRSGLTALFGRRRSRTVAVAMSSGLFGLWHVLPEVDAFESNAAGATFGPSRRARFGSVAAVVAATAVAGVGFSLLAQRARSVVAPVILHAALNGSAYAAGRLISLVR
jgi:uncharacterized protein